MLLDKDLARIDYMFRFIVHSSIQGFRSLFQSIRQKAGKYPGYMVVLNIYEFDIALHVVTCPIHQTEDEVLAVNQESLFVLCDAICTVSTRETHHLKLQQKKA